MSWTDLILHQWHQEFRCSHGGCDKPIRLFGEWRPPKASPDEASWRRYEVVYIASLDAEAPEGDRWERDHYLPALIVCEGQDGSGISVWPRYWVKPSATVQFGQDGPLLSLEEWDYLMEKVRRFIASRAQRS